MGNQQSLTQKQYEIHRSRVNLGKEASEDTPNSKMFTENFLIAYNMRDNKKMQAHTADGVTFSFKGGDSCLTLELFIEQVEQLQASFPDIYNTWDEVLEVEPGVLKVTNFCSRGTHTGKPFSFGPFPPVPASGKVVEEGPSQLVFLIEKGKLVHFELDPPVGEITGPPGHYQKIGGVLELNA